jgi:hypothetical protein
MRGTFAHWHDEIRLFARECGLERRGQRRTDPGKISQSCRQMDLAGKLAHDCARSGKCGFSLGLNIDWLPIVRLLTILVQTVGSFKLA